MSDTVLSSSLRVHYGDRLRLRVMGLCLEKERLLLLKHMGFGAAGYLWAPPGGEVRFGESLVTALTREFYEETNLRIEVQHFLGLHEQLSLPLHAVECLFLVQKRAGELRLGSETNTVGEPVLGEACYFSIAELKLLPTGALHWLLQDIEHFSSLLLQRGRHTFCKSKEST